jgi:hypothetical protein
MFWLYQLLYNSPNFSHLVWICILNISLIFVLQAFVYYSSSSDSPSVSVSVSSSTRLRHPLNLMSTFSKPLINRSLLVLLVFPFQKNTFTVVYHNALRWWWYCWHSRCLYWRLQSFSTTTFFCPSSRSHLIPQRRHVSTWVCTYCTFHVQGLATPLCPNCDHARPITWSCGQCTMINENRTDCTACMWRHPDLALERPLAIRDPVTKRWLCPFCAKVNAPMATSCLNCQKGSYDIILSWFSISWYIQSHTARCW